MKREQLADLAAFVAVAQERSFTRAAAKLGITQSSLSHTIRRLESHLGVRLLDAVRADLDAGRLVRVLADWCAPFSGYHLYYPSRRQPTPAFALIVEALRYRGS